MLPAISDADVQPLRTRKNRLGSRSKAPGRQRAPRLWLGTRCCVPYRIKNSLIFQFAGSNGLRDLARLAIASFWKIPHLINREYDDMPDYVCENIPGKYGAALIVAVADHPRVKGLTPQVRWEGISASFNVR
jgi:hypothetical protein